MGEIANACSMNTASKKSSDTLEISQSAFRFEKDMLSTLIPALPELFTIDEGFAHACEVTDGLRVIDIVFASLPRQTLVIEDWESYAKALKRLSHKQMYVLSKLWHCRRMTLKKLSSLIWTDADVVLKEYVGPMLKLGLLREVRRNTYEVTEWAHWKLDQVITIELKLKKWQEALEQALDNKNRSDLAFVAFPSDELKNKKIIYSEAKKKGIGIIEIDPVNGAFISVEAKPTNCSVRFRNWAFYLRIISELVNTDNRWKLGPHLFDEGTNASIPATS